MSPSEKYTERLSAREAQLNQLDKLNARLGNARLVLAVVFAITVWLCLSRQTFSAMWLLVPMIVFIGIVLYHQTVQRARSRVRRAVQFYRSGLDRIQDRWMGKGLTGEHFDIPHHIYAADLDLFGKGSLYELLSTARTPMGQNALAQWLLSPASVDEIHLRHANITDLRNRLELREELAILGEQPSISLHPEKLTTWAEAPNQLNQRWISWLASSLAGLAAMTAIVWAHWGFAFPFLIVLLLEIGITYLLRKQVQTVISDLEKTFDDLKLLSVLLNRLEREQFNAPSLQALILKLSSHTLTASRAIARLATIVNLIESRRNLILRPFILPLMYSLHFATAAERWRSAHGKAVRSWLAVLGEIEALISIAGYSYEHPDNPFPEFVDGPATFQAIDLGHPLIPADRRIRNDVNIVGKIRLLLVSGSNMSGKSTLLRTVGINSVLAMAGAPVCAKRLQLTPVQVGASIRINDSLHEGSSRFYAEITRLRQLFEPGNQALPLLFLLDELLQGTNSKDRRIGAEGVIRALVERGAIGLISTHDLALADIVGLEAEALKNVHFQDELENGKLRFDFKLRDGIVTKSNGIELMRSIGLNV